MLSFYVTLEPADYFTCKFYIVNNSSAGIYLISIEKFPMNLAMQETSSS